MRQLLLILSLLVIFSSCLENNKKVINIKALPINGKINGDVISGSSILNDPNRFVWGGSVIKGDDNKYHMLYSTWEFGFFAL